MASDELLEKIYSKVEKISEDVGELKVSQAVMQEDVKHHVKRSDMLEDMYNEMRDQDIEPMKEDINKFKGGLKIIAYLTGLVGVVLGALKLFKI